MPDHKVTDYDRNATAWFMRSREQHGQLSNMTFGYPLAVNGLRFQGPEGLYQSLKYPNHPPTQRRIAVQRSGMEAKHLAYAEGPQIRSDWDDVRVTAMAYTLATKLHQHPRHFGAALLQTEDLPIVEMSQRDAFWGANPRGTRLVGVNMLGKLLTQLRDLYRFDDDPQQAVTAFLQDHDLKFLSINGQPVTPL